MKSFLYAGAALMIGASIYGFVDYNKTSHKKEFNEMYAEKKTTKPVEVTATKVTPDVTNHVAAAKTAVKKKVAVTNNVAKKEKKNSDVVATAVVNEEKKVVKKKKRRISTEIFSRAPLREEEEELPAPEKSENKNDDQE